MQRIQSGDQVLITSGKDKGRTGTVTSIKRGEQRILVEGINMAKKHVRPNPQAGMQGGIVEQEMPIHISNVMLVDEDGKPSRVGFRTNDDGKKERFFKTNDKVVGA